MASCDLGSGGVNRSLVNQPNVSRQPAVNVHQQVVRVGLEEHEHRVDHDQRGDHRAHDPDDRGEEREDACGAGACHARHDLPVTPGPHPGRDQPGPQGTTSARWSDSGQPRGPRRVRSRCSRPRTSTWSSCRSGRPPGTSPPRRSGACRSRPLPGAAPCSGRPSAPAGSRLPVSDRITRRSWRVFQPGMKDRCVVQTVNSPNGAVRTAATATRGSSLTQIGVLDP